MERFARRLDQYQAVAVRSARRKLSYATVLAFWDNLESSY